MDSEREDSAHESVADNDFISDNANLNGSGDLVSKNVSNGSVDIDQVKQLSDSDLYGVEVQDKGPVNLMPGMAGKSSGSDAQCSPVSVEKGKGLRKWRRIKREVTKEGGVVFDSCKLTKRGFSNAGVQGKPMPFSSEMRQRSDGSVSSTHAMVQSVGGLIDGFAVGDSGQASGPFVPTVADTENSDDRSSKSSTAASILNMRYGGPVAAGQVNGRNKIANTDGMNFGSSFQKVPQGKDQKETSKKPPGEQVDIEKETSHSSMESDSRSSNFVFMQDNRPFTRNGRQNGGSINYGGENGLETLANAGHATEQLRSGYGRNSGESEDVSQEDINEGSSWSVKDENSENQGSSTDQDVLIQSIHMLQSAQEAIEKEIKKFREIGKEDIIVDDSSQNTCLPSELTSVGLEVNGSGGDERPHLLHTLEIEVSSLRENKHVMEIKLEETTAMLQMKEAKIGELEGRLGSLTNQKEVNFPDLESELEAVWKQRIEADIEYLTISRTIQDLRIASVDQISQLDEKTALEQSQITNKLIDAESKAENLKRDAKKLERHCEDLVIADETVILQNSVCKYSTCFLIQLILLAVILGIFILQLSHHSAGVVPT
ncbi:hypothetical protein Leryth_010165 [Lithospermum erythrorhizon]|nr:hypothetical protein Leryth_010165 [Lithospermum erythrorhizon]